MYKSLGRDDIVCMMLAGLVISMYNIIDGEKLFNETGIPIIAITRKESTGLEKSIRGRFQNWEEKMGLYVRLGAREKTVLHTGKAIFTQRWGVDQRKVTSLLNSFTIQGGLPEPIRAAKLAARALSSAML